MCMIIYYLGIRWVNLRETGMIKQEVFQSNQQYDEKHWNRDDIFGLTQTERQNINRRLPVGFSLVKINELPADTIFEGPINYLGGQRPIRVASQQLALQFALQMQTSSFEDRDSKSQERKERTQRNSSVPEGRGKHSQKVKNILQRFRKHPKFNFLWQHLNRLGYAHSLMQIENQNRKNVLTIQFFRQRMLFVLNQALFVTYSVENVLLINQMIDQLNFLVETAQKNQFTNSLSNLQRSLDKITRQMTQIKESGNYFYKKRKRHQKNYEEKELLHIAKLMKALPQWEMVGIIQILQEKPFNQIQQQKFEFDLNKLKPKKIRQIECYVKRKHTNHYKSVQRKHQKRKDGKAESVKPQSQKSEQKSQKSRKSRQSRNQAQEDESFPVFNSDQAEIAHIFQYAYIDFGNSKKEKSDSDQDRPFEQQYDFSRDFNFHPSQSPKQNHSSSVYEANDSQVMVSAQANESQGMGSGPIQNFSSSSPNVHYSNPQSSRKDSQKFADQQQVYSSSDSSFITDEDDSDF